MKKIILSGVFTITLLLLKAQTAVKETGCNSNLIINSNFSKAAVLDSILRYYTTNQLPGATLAVYTEKEGWWVDARGYADVYKKIPMQNCHLQYLQSVSKTFMAIEILQFKEQGKINLDEPITKYLHLKYSRYIKNAEKITVRMLLNHTSGVPEYNSNPNFLSRVIQHPLEDFTPEEMLQSFEGEDLQFAPGSKYQYTNTNYMLLSLIGDALTGDHAAYIREHIFKPLNLHNTYYAKDFIYLHGLNLPASYWDLANDGTLVDISGLQKMTVEASKGDDGIVCTAADAVKFMKGLIEGKLLSPESMKEMLEFVKDEKGNKRYGMGLVHFDLGGIEAYGHGGGGIGAGCALVYIPSYKTYVFVATNVGVLLDGKLPEKAGEMKDAVLLTLLK
jgi:D-alanyl-D-alanine carboxypeptidase